MKKYVDLDVEASLRTKHRHLILVINTYIVAKHVKSLQHKYIQIYCISILLSTKLYNIQYTHLVSQTVKRKRGRKDHTSVDLVSTHISRINRAHGNTEPLVAGEAYKKYQDHTDSPCSYRHSAGRRPQDLL